MPLVTHVGAADGVNYGGVESYAIRMIETGSFFSHGAVWWLIYGGVFERFPGLKLVITETPGSWFAGLARELDASWRMFSTHPEMNAAFYRRVPRPPSEYMGSNVFMGASFASPFEVQQAVEHGFSSQVLWGSDHPHVEGTYLYQSDPSMPSVTRLSLRNTFCDLAPADIRAMVGGNAIDAYGLDRAGLQAIADRIDAPTIDELTTPIDAVPEGASLHAFRSSDTGWS
jgi:predicted TIM-barrel fold metal-dependent hydrolase